MATHKAPEHNFTIVSSLDKNTRSILEKVDEDEAFWVADLNCPRESLSLWEENLPDVKPFYAMKCCDEPNLLKFLARRGAGFDCASKVEIQTILKLGVDPSNILFSHPLKSYSAIRYAKDQGVKRMVYDTKEELEKILKIYPDAEVYLRVKPKFTNAKIQLSDKFGASTEEIDPLLKITKEYGAKFIGFSFHVGSLCDDVTTFQVALNYVSDLKSQAERYGLHVRFIDIGGGFLPPNAPSNYKFEEIAKAINRAIEENFDEADIEFCAEPGRFIASEYMDLHLPIICARQFNDINDKLVQSVYIPDGMYGAFNSLSYDHAEPHFDMYRKNGKGDDSFKISTTLWGQTCDSADVIYDSMMWPKMEIGDYLSIRKFGAYTYSPTSFFNGFNHHKVFVVNEESDGEY
ncbi:Pyridoxal-dependent decarboxylase, pyridoxal binding domain containing protein [Histomonas meleagridis]|uniref:Pyridoxal-dependent decarboxylase, pyridoxal binding domain containing protein n=1 Tax=Histomonas meleagridis TaxID=135588 RepID=UPI00355A27B5|nr:Pyridoxal-dependent decarboxylase, pyridoxal binding domain containing protein [Histomonas meleagridis]KAH0797029.1 Pyridoxal-dependent decarboxylase, pyridoxal binding domain containing protein [Histomonas meleagridis]